MAENVLRKRLSGDRNQCPTCGLYFNSTSAFDKHRVGKHSIPDGKKWKLLPRRCLTPEEMMQRNMFERDGWWYGSARPSSSISKSAPASSEGA